MKCPRCRTRVDPWQKGCAACGFSASVLHSYLGNQWVRLERLTDSAHCLRLEDARKIEVLLDDFERNYPQAFFASYLGILPKELSPSELGFWLLNQGAFNTHSLNKRNDFGIVLVVDPSARTTSLTLGYAVEEWFSEAALIRLLRDTGAHLKAGRFGKAIETACGHCDKLLRKHAKVAKWKPDVISSPDLGLEPLRGGHRAVSQVHSSVERPPA